MKYGWNVANTHINPQWNFQFIEFNQLILNKNSQRRRNGNRSDQKSHVAKSSNTPN
ncbi:hypothetical protein N9181_01560 [bacterium]|nr:hypothetical protein [bacterium]